MKLRCVLTEHGPQIEALNVSTEQWIRSGNLLTLEIDDIAQLTNKII